MMRTYGEYSLHRFFNTFHFGRRRKNLTPSFYIFKPLKTTIFF